MAADANLVLQASVTKVANFNSTGVGLPTGTPRRGLVARVIHSATGLATSTGTVTFSIEHGDTLGGTYYLLSSAADDVITLSATAQAGEIFIPFQTERAFVRLVCTFGGSPGTPTTTYFGDIVLAHP